MIEGLDLLFEAYHRALSPLIGRPDRTNPYIMLSLGEVAALLSRRIETAVNGSPSPGCWISADGSMIACYRCGRISHNRHDVDNRYCGRCHVFHSDAPGQRLRDREKAMNEGHGS